MYVEGIGIEVEREMCRVEWCGGGREWWSCVYGGEGYFVKIEWWKGSGVWKGRLVY